MTNDCWLWAGSTYSSGHGVLYLGYKQGKNLTVPAYRVMYENEVGEIPDGLEIDHLCETPACVNPAHLEAVTHRENTLRHYRRRTHCRNGHEYTPENTYWVNKKSNISKSNPTGESRSCKTCH